jgi:secreted PhoX family phosphatase
MSHSSDDPRYFGNVLAQRLTRRSVLQGALSAVPALAAAGLLPFDVAGAAVAPGGGLTFTAIKGSKDDSIVLPSEYVADVVIRWGDSLFPGTPDLDTRSMAGGGLLTATAAARQARQFGYNCDAIAFFPLNADNSSGVLCVNNEYTDDTLLFPDYGGSGGRDAWLEKFVVKYPESVAFAKAAHGVSVVAVGRDRKRNGPWGADKTSRFNRRITVDTPMSINGPARGSPLLRTRADPEGIRVNGTLANCAGGKTPWGTYLTGEENIEDYFGNFRAMMARRDLDPALHDAHRRFWLWNTASVHGWEFIDKRFDAALEPSEALRFGWIVEIDPRNPASMPKKRTALGRFSHEGANPILAKDGRIAVYMGDDEKFEYVYKFVTSKPLDPRNPAANADLLDEGTLYAARFDASGEGEWLPLVFDANGKLNPASGFANQAEVLIKARAAADVLGATPMDRPEDVEPNPVNGRIYVSCTNNDSRSGGVLEVTGRTVNVGPNAANPRAGNGWGHIIEITEDDGDHTRTRFRWEVFLMAGDPTRGKLITKLEDLKPGKVERQDTYYAGFADAARLSPIGSPDNVGFDRAGNLWIVTDGTQPHDNNDGCFACPTSGPERGLLKQLMSGPVGCEVGGCEFTPDNGTLFLSIQHPGEGGTLKDPKSHWPDGGDSQPRPSVVAIRRKDGGVVGT